MARPSTMRVPVVNVLTAPFVGRARLDLSVPSLIGVADGAVLDVVAVAAVEERSVLLRAQAGDAAELAVAALAIRVGDDIAREIGRRDLGAGRGNEVVDRIDRVLHRHRGDAGRGPGRRVRSGPGCGARKRHRQPVRKGGLKCEVAEVGLVVRAGHRHRVDLGLDCRDVAMKRVAIAAIAVVDKRAGVVGARPGRRRGDRCRRHRRDDVAHPLARRAGGAGHELGDREGEVGIARGRRIGGLRLVAEACDGAAEAVRDGEIDDRRARDRDLRDRDGRLELGPGGGVGLDRAGVRQGVAADIADPGASGGTRRAGGSGGAGGAFGGRTCRAGVAAATTATGNHRSDQAGGHEREEARIVVVAHSTLSPRGRPRAPRCRCNEVFYDLAWLGLQVFPERVLGFRCDAV